MIRRLIIATTILISTLSGVAMHRAPDSRPQLLVFKADWCGPCKQFSSDFADRFCRRTPFGRELERRYDCQPAYSEGKDAATFNRHSVKRVPTFILLDRSGREVTRVTGYTSSDQLLLELQSRPPRRTLPSPQPPALRPPGSQPPERTQRISEANQQLETERDELVGRIRILEENLSNAQQAAANHKTQAAEATGDAKKWIEEFSRDRDAQIAAQQRQLDELRSQLQAKQTDPAAGTARTPEKDRPPQSSRDGRETTIGESSVGEESTPDLFTEIDWRDVGDISAETSPVETATYSTWDSWRSLGRKAIVTGLKLTKPELAIPLSIATGVAGWLIRRRMKRKKGDTAKPRSATFPVVHDQSVEDAMPLPRDLDEARELLRLRQKEGRHAVHDGLFGALADAELEKLIEDGDATALRLRDTLHQRMNEIAPLSTNPNEDK